MKVKYFEAINFNPVNDEYISDSIDINGESIEIDLNFENKNTTQQELETLNNFLENIANYLDKNSAAITEDLKTEESTVNDYISNHLEEIPEEELEKIIDLKNTDKTNEEKLFEKLKLKRIGIYPQTADQYAVFDYSIGEEFTQYLVVIYTDENGNITDISMES